MSDISNTYYANDGAFDGYGTQWMIGDGATPETFQAVRATISVTPGDMTTANIPRTHLRSPEAHHESFPGLRNSGPFTMKLTWLPKDESQSNTGGGSGSFSAGGIIALWRSRAIKNHKLVLPDGSPATEWPFEGYISQFQPGQIANDTMVDATVQVTPTRDFSADLP